MTTSAIKKRSARPCGQGGIDDETMRAVLQWAKDLVEDAPELTPQQILLLRSIFANRAGGDGA